MGGPQLFYNVLLGRRDARTASKSAANTNLPPPTLSFSQLISNFKSHGLNLKDLVALSGGHTIGFAKCNTFRNRIYNETNIDPSFAASLRKTCPRKGGDSNLSPLDSTPTRVDTTYYRDLIYKKGLLHSDQQLFEGKGRESDKLVQLYSKSPLAFARDFKSSMIKMGNMKPLTGSQGEIRINCRRVRWICVLIWSMSFEEFVLYFLLRNIVFDFKYKQNDTCINTCTFFCLYLNMQTMFWFKK